MISTQLRRRVERIMKTPAVLGLGVRGKLEFIDALEAAGTYSRLPKEWRTVIRAGESWKTRCRSARQQMLQTEDAA